MTLKDTLSDDWDDVVLAPMLASFAVTACDPSGLLGVIRESSAAARAMEAARDDQDPLVREVMEDYDTPETRDRVADAVADLTRGRNPAEATAEAVARISSVSRRLDARGVDAKAYRLWLRLIAEDVAEASSEGGFLGFGGQKISEAERKTLADIDAALSTGIG